MYYVLINTAIWISYLFDLCASVCFLLGTVNIYFLFANPKKIKEKVKSIIAIHVVIILSLLFLIFNEALQIRNGLTMKQRNYKAT